MGLTCQYFLTEQYIRNVMYKDPMAIVASRKIARSFTFELVGSQAERFWNRTLSHQDSSIKCQPTTDRPENTAAIADTRLTNEQQNERKNE
jgi:hypothetical protein